MVVNRLADMICTYSKYRIELSLFLVELFSVISKELNKSIWSYLTIFSIELNEVILLNRGTYNNYGIE